MSLWIILSQLYLLHRMLVNIKDNMRAVCAGVYHVEPRMLELLGENVGYNVSKMTKLPVIRII